MIPSLLFCSIAWTKIIILSTLFKDSRCSPEGFIAGIPGGLPDGRGEDVLSSQRDEPLAHQRIVLVDG